jgi:hypothetical protein
MHDRGAGRKPAGNSGDAGYSKTITIATDRYPKH